MTFDSMDALKNYILSRSKVAIQMAQEKVYQVIDRFVKEYYAEYDPIVYERTYQLYRSLVKADIQQTANGWEAEIYFDLDALDYHMRRMNGKWYSRKDNSWSEQKTLSSAAHGHHGGKYAGTAIWDEPMIVLWKNKHDILKKALLDAGIPVK